MMMSSLTSNGFPRIHLKMDSFPADPEEKVEDIKTRGLNKLTRTLKRWGNVQNVRCALKWTFPTLSFSKTTDRELSVQTVRLTVSCHVVYYNG